MKKYFKASLGLLVAAISLSSCLKEKPLFDPANSASVVELGDVSATSEFASTDYPYNVYNGSFDVASTASTYSIPVKYSGGAAPQDITVTLAVDNSVITKYNTFHGYTSTDAYAGLNTAYYTVPSYTVVIPKGQSATTFNITVNPSLFGFTQKWALGISVKSTTLGTPSGNFGTSLYILQAKNAYEGNYSTTGYFFHPSSPRALNATKYLSTLGVSSCKAPLGDLGSSNYYFGFTINGSALTNWTPLGATPAGTASGFMTVDNAAPFPATADQLPGKGAWLVSTYNNSYNAASKTFLMHYGYNGSPNAYTRQAYEKWVRQ
jgi:hypothetical protein